MYSKDISICRKVILDTISELRKKEKESQFTSDSFKFMEQRMVLMKALKIIKN